MEAPGSSLRNGRPWRPYVMMGGLGLLFVAMVATVIWWLVRTPAEALELAQQPAPLRGPEQPGEELLTPEGKRQAIDEAAGEMARRIDDLESRSHLATSLLDQTWQGLELIEALAGGNLEAIPDATDAPPGGQPYQTQFDTLFVECRDYVREHVKRGACTRSEVWETARDWADEKQREIEQRLEELTK